MRKVASGIVVAGLVATGACSVLGRQAFRTPVITVKDVQIKGLGLNGGSMDILLDVYNPNRFRLDATRLTYELFVDTIPFGAGATDTHFAVQSGDSTEVHLPLTFTWTGVGAAGRSLMNTGSVYYRVTGDLTVGSSVGTATLAYDRTGRFTTSGLGR